MKIRWIQVSCSEEGQRSSNQDFVATYSFRRGSLYIAVVCDGVGGRSFGGECARAVGGAAKRKVIEYFEQRPASGLSKDDLPPLLETLASFDVVGMPEDSATTLGVVIFEGRKLDREHGLIALWAGDTRVSVLESCGTLRQISRDHRDEEGRLTRYVNGLGQVVGELEGSFIQLPRPCAIAITTDGVHESCAPLELAEFFLYCSDHAIRTPRRLATDLTVFLGDNVCDNFSLSLLHRNVSPEEISRILSYVRKDNGVTCPR
jgi:serine/threonine protein phosphatase PrpC